MPRFLLLLCGLVLASPALAQGQTVLDPTAPIGIEAGRFIIYPAVEATVAVTNPATSPGWSFTISPEIKFQADWGALSSELTFDADVSPTSGLAIATMAELNLQYDINALWQLGIDASYQIAPDDIRDAALPVGVDAAPNIRTATGNVTLAGPIGNFGVNAGVSVVRNAYDAAMVGGVPVDQSERNNTVVTASLRLQTQSGALFTPFVEGTAGRRFYDQAVGSDGFLQAGNFFALRAGIAYDSSPVLTGEIGVGYHWEMPDDPALASSGAITVDGNAVWSPREPLSFTLSLMTTFNPDASPTFGGSVSRSVSVASTWQLRQTVQLTAQGGYGVTAYADGTVERSATAGAGVVWIPDRWLRISAGYTQNWYWSPDPTRAGTTGTFTLTARVQR
jgi:hypothetical protein